MDSTIGREFPCTDDEPTLEAPAPVTSLDPSGEPLPAPPSEPPPSRETPRTTAQIMAGIWVLARRNAWA